MLVVSDVHDAAAALARVAAAGETLLVLGDLVNLVDYRTGEGIIAEVIGTHSVLEIAELRSQHRPDEASALWRASVAGREDEIGVLVSGLMEAQYERIGAALEGCRAFVTYGNVDRPSMLRRHLPPSAEFVDGTAVEIEGLRIGFAGGGLPRLGTDGEVADDAMRDKLDGLGPVDVLCTHVAPAIDVLARDVIGRTAKGSEPVREYLEAHAPPLHLFGDVHQPRAVQWTHGRTVCRNVGYFRATGRPFVLDP